MSVREEDLKSKRHRIFEIIQIGNTSDAPSKWFDISLAIVILVNVAIMFMQTFEQFAPYNKILDAVEAVTLVFFCVEYALRLWTADYLFPDYSRGKAIWSFMKSFDGIVMLLTILPFFFLTGFVVFRILRVVRMLHLFRINSSFDSFNVIASVIYDKRNQLMSSVFIVIVLMLAASLCMYSAEHEAQPDSFKNAFSGIWWSMSTIFTVGYGDISPITTVGQIMGIVISFLGVGAVAIPTGIISAGFVERYTEMANSAISEDVMLHTVTVDLDSMWIGKTATEVERDHGYTILLARRGEAQILPNDSYQVHVGDKLAVYHVDKPGEKIDINDGSSVNA